MLCITVFPRKIFERIDNDSSTSANRKHNEGKAHARSWCERWFENIHRKHFPPKTCWASHPSHSKVGLWLSMNWWRELGRNLDLNGKRGCRGLKIWVLPIHTLVKRGSGTSKPFGGDGHWWGTNIDFCGLWSKVAHRWYKISGTRQYKCVAYTAYI